MHRFLTESSGIECATATIEFFKEEILKHQQCLAEQREYYSERAVRDVEAALSRLIAHLDQVCAQRDAEQFMSRLLRKIDVITGLSAWTDPRKVN